jgi:hypothetical protein
MPKTIPVPQQDAVGLGAYGGGWSVATVMDISSAAQVQLAVNRDTNVLHLYSDSDIYVLFDTTDGTTNTTANDLILPAGLHSIPVPRGLYSGEADPAQLKDTIYMHAKQVTSALSKSLRAVES